MRGFVDAYNSGDIDAVMAFFTDESVMTGHPFTAEAAGPIAIRAVQSEDLASAATGAAYTISNVEVSVTTVTWDHVWNNNVGQQWCGVGHNAVIEDGKILSWTWPEPFLCP